MRSLKHMASAGLIAATLAPLHAASIDNYGSPVSGTYFSNIAGSTITRPADITAYAANETVCASKSVVCVPGTIVVSSSSRIGHATAIRMTLFKSGSSTTNASFTIWLFSAAPGLATPTQEDSTAYTGPRSADAPNYLGNATCTSGTATSDTSAGVWYECALSNPNGAGALIMQALSGTVTINYLLSVTAAYTPVSGETFTPYLSGIY